MRRVGAAGGGGGRGANIPPKVLAKQPVPGLLNKKK
jgi:hypothetical protein